MKKTVRCFLRLTNGVFNKKIDTTVQPFLEEKSEPHILNNSIDRCAIKVYTHMYKKVHFIEL